MDAEGRRDLKVIATSRELAVEGNAQESVRRNQAADAAS